MDFLMDQGIIYTSKRYEEIYTYFNTKLGFKYHELFTTCAALGFKKGRMSDIDSKGREFRTNYLNLNQKTTMYSIILSDIELGKNIEAFEEEGFPSKARKRIEQYAEGGMDILVEDVFGSRWNGYKLDESYTEYDVDVLSYIYGDSVEVPF